MNLEEPTSQNLHISHRPVFPLGALMGIPNGQADDDAKAGDKEKDSQSSADPRGTSGHAVDEDDQAVFDQEHGEWKNWKKVHAMNGPAAHYDHRRGDQPRTDDEQQPSTSPASGRVTAKTSPHE